MYFNTKQTSLMSLYKFRILLVRLYLDLFSEGELINIHWFIRYINTEIRKVWCCWTIVSLEKGNLTSILTPPHKYYVNHDYTSHGRCSKKLFSFCILICFIHFNVYIFISMLHITSNRNLFYVDTISFYLELFAITLK